MRKGLHGLPVLSLAVLLSAGCAFSAERMQAGLNPWVGNSIDNLIARWGPPSGVFDMPTSGGNKVYTWFYQGNTVVTANYFPSLNMAMATAGTNYCRIDWTVDSSGRIQTYRWEGQCRLL